MKIKVLRKMEHKGYMIYVLQFNHIFQYLFANKKGDIFQDHINLKPSIKNRIKFMLRRIPVPYTKDEMEYGEEVILSGAVSSIDKMIENSEEGKVVKKKGQTIKNTTCIWQVVTEEEDSKIYHCIKHDVTSRVPSDSKPFHVSKDEKILSPYVG